MSPDIVAVLLAGGRATRMGGGDKPLLQLAGRPLLAHGIARLAPQVAALAINANGDPDRFAGFGLPVLADPVEGHQGPLAGVLAGLIWARTVHPGARHLLTAAGDTPLLPHDLAARLLAAVSPECPVAMASSGGHPHPTIALWPVVLEPAVCLALERGERRVRALAMAAGCTLVEWPAAPLDPFLNVNTPDQLAEADRLVTAEG